MKRMTAMITLVVAMLVLIAPVLIAEDASAGSVLKDRISSYNVLESVTTLESTGFVYGSEYYMMIEGSENHRAMEAYIADPLNGRVTSDDREILYENVGETVHIYYLTSYDWSERDIWVQDKNLHFTRVLEAYGAPIPAESDDVVKIRFIDAVSNTGSSSDTVYICSVDGSGVKNTEYSMYAGMLTSFVAEEGHTYTLESYWSSGGLYFDVSYYLDVSAPNGSATLFAAVCFVIAGLTIAILLASLIRPKWSR